MAQRKENQLKEYRPRLGARGPRPNARGLRPNAWITGPDPRRHNQYTAWMRARAQANFRKEGWTMTFEEFEQMWNQDGSWEQRGRRADDLLMTRLDSGMPWSFENCYIEVRRIHLQQHGRMQQGCKRGRYKPRDNK